MLYMMIGKHHFQYLFLRDSDKYKMDNNLDKVAKDLYGKIQTRFPNIKIGDENAQVLSKKSDIPKARFFEFEYEEHGEPLGTIAVTLDMDDGIIIQVSGDLANNTSSSYHDAYSFIRSFRKFAKNRLLNFDVQNIGKSNLDKRDYQFQSKPKNIQQIIPQNTSQETAVMESKMFGTSRISYQDLGEARIVVKHNQVINPEISGSRSMHIESIYIENVDGERFKYPFKHLNGARALAEHIKHGGNPYDSIGKHITGLSEELNQLRKFKNYVGRQTQISEAMGSVTDKVLERIENVKKEINHLQRSSYYESFVETFKENSEQIIPEEIMNDWIDRLTVRTFNEELKAVFPFLYNIVETSELPVRELTADDLLDETFGKEGLRKRLEKAGFGTKEQEEYWKKSAKEKEERHAKADAESAQRDKEWKEKFGKKTESLDPESVFESFIEKIINENKDELFSPLPGARNKAINDFNILLTSEMTGGDAGVLALKGLIDDPELTSKVAVLNTDEEVRDEIKQYILDKDPELLKLIKGLDAKQPEEIGGDKQTTPPAQAPAPMPAPAPAPAPAPDMGTTPPPPTPDMGTTPPSPAPMPAPMAESKTKMKAKFIKAKVAGANLDTNFAEGMTIRDALKECGINPEECGFSDQDDNETDDDSGIDQLLKVIAGFWNAKEKNFTIGGTRAKIKVVKAYEDGKCSNASEDDVKRVLRMIDIKDPSSNTLDTYNQDDNNQDDNREQSLQNIVNELVHIKRNAGLI